MSVNPLSTTKLLARRFAADRNLLVTIFVGITIATAVVAMAPAYLRSLERLALNLAVDRLERPYSNINTFSYRLPLTADEMRRTEQTVAMAVDDHLLPIQENRERYVLVRSFLAGLPQQPMPPPSSSLSGPQEPEMVAFARRVHPEFPEAVLWQTYAPGAQPVSLRLQVPDGAVAVAQNLQQASLPVNRASLRYLSHMQDHVTFVDGSMAGALGVDELGGPSIEGVVGVATAGEFGLRVGDIITIAPAVGSRERLFIRVAGIVEATDPWEDFWKPHASLFLDPPPVEDEDVGPTSSGDGDLEYDASRPPIPIFTTMDALTEVVGPTFRGTLVDSIWFIMVDKGPLKEWSASEALLRLRDYENQVARGTPGSEVLTRISDMLRGFERRAFFTKVPLLLLTSVITVALLFYLAMIVSYLVRSRERDSALLRSRGVGGLHLLRIYLLEWFAMTFLAILLSPWLAFAAVALAGKLPYFRSMTGGEMLPVEVSATPFLAAIVAGLVCLVVYVVPGMLSARGGLLVHKLRSSRPPSVPFFHRYYMDVGLLALGGLTFWELSNRGHLVGGGLFKDVEVNETLLLAPVLFLVVVALVFIRFFPLVVRYVSGESPALLHLLAASGASTAAFVLLSGDMRDGDGLVWRWPVVLMVAFGGVYWATAGATRLSLALAGLSLQAVLVAAFLAAERPAAGEPLFAAAALLVGAVIGQAAYPLLRVFGSVTPVWLLMGLRRMSRDPLQYTWLVLLLVLVTGLGVLSTTVGESLERNQQDRINYEVGSDLRVSDIPQVAGGAEALKERYLDTPGVALASLAFRDRNGAAAAERVEVLALESRDFPYMSWYRDDFSTGPLGDVMGVLRSHASASKLVIPEGSHTIGVWVKPDQPSPGMSLWMVVEDRNGAMDTLSLGRIGSPEWHLMEAPLPSRLRHPLSLVSVQVYEPGVGAVLTPGTLLLDDIHIKVGPRNEERVLVDFEDLVIWTPIITPSLTQDSFLFTRQDRHSGQMAGRFSFGRESQLGVRGIYRSPTGGPLPVVVSGSFVEATGTEVGQRLVVGIDNRFIPVVIRGTIDYFPTLSSNEGRFILADLDGLLAHVNVLSHVRAFTANEIFLTEAPGAQESVQDAVSVVGGLFGRVTDRASLLESARLDPLTAAGWRSMVVLSMGVVVLAAVLGYATHVLSFASRSESEMGFLKTLGFSRRQMLGLLGFEHLAIVAVGLGLGTWAGFQMSHLMVSAVSVTETGESAIPPFLLITDWSLMIGAYSALVATFVAVLFVLRRGIDRLDLQAISRVEGP